MKLAGGHQQPPPWLDGSDAVYGTMIAFNPGDNDSTDAIVKLDRRLHIGDADGDIIVMSRRYAEPWASHGVVHLELCATQPETKPRSKRQVGTWIESHAEYEIAAGSTTDGGEVLFTPEELTRADQHLHTVDRLLSDLAKEHVAKLMPNAGKRWPGRELRKRIGFRTFSLRMQLNPNYLTDGEWSYVLSRQWSLRFGELLTRVLAHEVIRTFTPAELQDELGLQVTLKASLERAR